jgi:hypothetical protein
MKSHRHASSPDAALVAASADGGLEVVADDGGNIAATKGSCSASFDTSLMIDTL